MKVDVHGRQIELEPNSKPLLVKRLAADGFDIFLIFVLFMVFTALLLKTPLADTYNAHYAQYRAMEETTAAALGGDKAAVGEALNRDAAYQNERFAANLHGYLLKAAACFLAESLILLVCPFLTRFRATPGKLMTGIIPFSEKRQSRMAWYQVVSRFLFVLVIDSLALYLYTGILTFLLLPVLRLVELLISRKKNKTVCDYVTGIMMIEKLSYDGINSFQGGEKR